MDKFNIIHRGDRMIKVCSSEDFDDVLKWVRENDTDKIWSEVIMRDDCYQDPGRKHFTLKVLNVSSTIFNKLKKFILCR